MSITDELRECVTGAKPPVVDGCWINVGSMTYGCKEALLAIADHIDAEHEAMLVDARKTVYQGYIELPKDADGEYIHVGDELRDAWHEQNQGEVEWLMLDHHGWWLMLKSNSERFYVHDFHEWHHRHRQSTVEDMLHELIDEWVMADSTEDEEAAIAEYAAKLRLANSEE